MTMIHIESDGTAPGTKITLEDGTVIPGVVKVETSISMDDPVNRATVVFVAPEIRAKLEIPTDPCPLCGRGEAPWGWEQPYENEP